MTNCQTCSADNYCQNCSLGYTPNNGLCYTCNAENMTYC
jgi:hypothetical protein